MSDIHPPRGYNFLGLTEEEAAYDSARVVVVPVAYDGTTSYRAGTKYGPAAIIAASREVETFDYKTKREIAEIGIATALEVEAEADGPLAMVDAVEVEIARHIGAGKYVVMLGGEHSLTTGSVRAHLKKYPALSVLHIDAHADMRDSFQGSRFSHASVMRRVRELCPAVSAGIRNASADCVESIESSKATIVWAEECVGKTGWHDRVLSGLSNQVYITFDLDAFDPAIMPAVGTPEPGGLQWYETLDLLRAVFSTRNVVGFDVVELSPIAGLHHADFLAAKLVAEMIRLTRLA